MIPPKMSLVSFQNLSFTPPGSESPLWQNLALRIHSGDRLLITGDSGVGKSTLLHILGGLVPKFSSGTLAGALKLEYKQAALVFQSPEAQRITPTVFEEVIFALENRAWPEEKIRKRANEALELFQLHALVNRSTAALSGGEAQRLSLACAFAQDPDILLLDEPTAYLDPWSRQDFFHLLSKVMSNRTMVLIDHQSVYLQNLVNRALQLTPSALITLDPKTTCKDFHVEDNVELGFKIDSTSRAKLSIKIKHLCHTYTGFPPLFEGLTAEFSPGRVSAIVGPSGAGKTTLLKKIMGLLPLTPESLFYGKKDVTQMRQRERFHSLLYLPQNPEQFFLRLTASEEWKLSQAPKSQIALAAKLFGLDPSSPLNVFHMSEGEKRRLMLALAFLDSRPVVLLDEPTLGLDQQAFTALVRGLKYLRSQGRTIILVTHSSALVRACADDVWFLFNGTISPCDSKEPFTIKKEEAALV